MHLFKIIRELFIYIKGDRIYIFCLYILSYTTPSITVSQFLPRIGKSSLQPSSFSLLLSLALPWKEGQRGCLSAGFDGTEREQKRNVRKEQKGGYLATKLSCLMLVADVGCSEHPQRTPREERAWLKVVANSEDISRVKGPHRFRASAYSRARARFKRNSYTGRHAGETVCSLRPFLRQISSSSRRSKNAFPFMPRAEADSPTSFAANDIPLGRFLGFEEIRFSRRADDTTMP